MMKVTPAVLMAVGAAVMFAIAAVAQNRAVSAALVSVCEAPGECGTGAVPAPVLGAAQLRVLTRSPLWVASVALTAVASVVHAGALVLAPVVIVQPIGVLAVPLAVVLASWASGSRPVASVWVATLVCVASVAGFVALADAQLRPTAETRYVVVLTVVSGTAIMAALLSLAASALRGWQRCAAFAASGATSFGLVSVLTRLVALHWGSGAYGPLDPEVWLPATGVIAALLFGTWAVQQAHATGAPAVVLSLLTVIDPVVAVFLGATLLGEGDTTDPGAVTALAGLAATAVAAALTLARRHPAGAAVTFQEQR